ncbi:MAG: TonB family protein [Spirochaetota bacterium]
MNSAAARLLIAAVVSVSLHAVVLGGAACVLDNVGPGGSAADAEADQEGGGRKLSVRLEVLEVKDEGEDTGEREAGEARSRSPEAERTAEESNSDDASNPGDASQDDQGRVSEGGKPEQFAARQYEQVRPGPAHSDEAHQRPASSPSAQRASPRGAYSPPEVRSQIAPSYPTTARRQGEEGVTRVRVEVSPSGDVKATEIAESSGSSLLDQAALDAVERTHFAPAKRGETKIDGAVIVAVEFSLR